VSDDVARDPDQIRDEIKETTARLSESIEAVAYKKSHIKEEAAEAVKEKRKETKQDLSQALSDVASRAKEMVVDTKEAVSSKVASILPKKKDEQEPPGTSEGDTGP
jgi:GTPase involved in cell partitioning and DNA repair